MTSSYSIQLRSLPSLVSCCLQYPDVTRADWAWSFNCSTVLLSEWCVSRLGKGEGGWNVHVVWSAYYAATCWKERKQTAEACSHRPISETSFQGDLTVKLLGWRLSGCLSAWDLQRNLTSAAGSPLVKIRTFKAFLWPKERGRNRKRTMRAMEREYKTWKKRSLESKCVALQAGIETMHHHLLGSSADTRAVSKTSTSIKRPSSNHLIDIIPLHTPNYYYATVVREWLHI